MRAKLAKAPRVLNDTAMRNLLIPLALITTPTMAQTAEVSEARLRADVAKLVSFGTRHTLSS